MNPRKLIFYRLKSIKASLEGDKRSCEEICQSTFTGSLPSAFDHQKIGMGMGHTVWLHAIYYRLKSARCHCYRIVYYRVSVDINMTSLRVKYKLEKYESEEDREDSRKKPIGGLHKFSELGRKFEFNFFVNVKYESKTQKWTSEGREISMNRSSSQGNAFI